MQLEEIIKEIEPSNKKAVNNARKHWDSIAKPLRSLGLLEEAIIKIAGISNELKKINLSKRALVNMCADNGVVCEGVTQTDSEVTAIVAENFTKKKSTAAIMCDMTGTDIFPIDIGIYRDMDNYLDEEKEGFIPRRIINRKISYGTNNLKIGPAMTRKQCIKAIEVGINIVKKLKEKGYNIIATGEMGIGNTTTSSAVCSVLLDISPKEVTGKGAGLSDSGLKNKIDVICSAIDINKPDRNDIIDVISKVGGYDIAGLVGLYIGGAIYKVPIVIDGFISGVAALAASKMNKNILDYMLPSHVSKEPAGMMILNQLGFKPLLTCEMCLGEGSGAISIMPLLDMACRVYNDMSTFSEYDFEYVML